MNKSILLAMIGISTFAYGAYIPIKAEAAQYMIQSAWNVSNKTGYQVKPWNWMDSHPVMRLLNASNDNSLDCRLAMVLSVIVITGGKKIFK